VNDPILFGILVPKYDHIFVWTRTNGKRALGDGRALADQDAGGRKPRLIMRLTLVMTLLYCALNKEQPA